MGTENAYSFWSVGQGLHGFGQPDSRTKIEDFKCSF